MPPHVLDEAVDVLLELPREAGLAGPRDPGDRDEPRPPLLRARVEQILDDPELAPAPHERRLETRRAPLSPARGDHAQRAMEPHRLGLALDLVQARVRESHGRLRRATGRLADENGARLRGALDAR